MSMGSREQPQPVSGAPAGGTVHYPPTPLKICLCPREPRNRPGAPIGATSSGRSPGRRVGSNRSKVRILFTLLCADKLSPFFPTAFRFTWLALVDEVRLVVLVWGG